MSPGDLHVRISRYCEVIRANGETIAALIDEAMDASSISLRRIESMLRGATGEIEGALKLLDQAREEEVRQAVEADQAERAHEAAMERAKERAKERAITIAECDIPY